VDLTVYKDDNGTTFACPQDLIEHKKLEYKESQVREDFDFDHTSKELLIMGSINYFQSISWGSHHMVFVDDKNRIFTMGNRRNGKTG
jgi:alpha-tubulin suppressor-like RCC1 family protein